MPMTLTEKILYQHALGWDRDNVRAGDVLRVSVDWTLASEIAWKGMNKTYDALGRPPLHDKDRFYLALDHTVDRGTIASDPRVKELVELSRSFSQEVGLTYFYDANTTIMHTEFFRQLVRPGEIILGADSHTSSHGGMGAFAIGLGGADVVAAMVQGSTWIQVPEAIRVRYGGRLAFGLTGKDMILATLGQLGRNTVAMERTVEYVGDEMESLSTDFRFSIANMTAELGGLNGIFPADRRVRQTLLRRRNPKFRDGGWWFEADEDATYVEDFDIDLDRLVPQVAKPYSPDNVCDIDEVLGEQLDGCFIGACTTSEEELALGALVAEQAMASGLEPSPEGQRLVVPGSLEIVERLGQAGMLDIYQRAGFRIGEPGCSMCIGIASDRAAPGEVWLSSQNRNFPNRMGKGSIAWLASAPAVAASALDLQIRDPRPFLERIDRDRLAAIVAPASDLPPIVHGRPTPVAVAPPSTEAANGAGAGEFVTGRVQTFGDHIDTDAMIAGEFCHLTTLEELGPKAFLHFRPDFVERVEGGENVLVAGEGWGTGSSREHAVWALKGAGVQAVIAKSFAFIHKRNLVNEALPFLVVESEDFYAAAGDGESVIVDPGTGSVSVQGQTYQGRLLAPSMTEIIDHGGLVPHVRQALEFTADVV